MRITLSLLLLIIGWSSLLPGVEGLAIYEVPPENPTDVSAPPPSDLLGKSLAEALHPRVVAIARGRIAHATLVDVLQGARIVAADRAMQERVAALVPTMDQAVMVYVGEPGTIRAAVMLFVPQGLALVVKPDETLAMHSYVAIW